MKIEISSKIISSTSAYLFLKEHNLLLLKRKRCSGHGKPYAEYTVVPLKSIFANSVGARVNIFNFPGDPSWYYSNFVSE